MTTIMWDSHVGLGQTWTWGGNNESTLTPNSGNWSANGDWDLGTVPTSGINTALVFNGSTVNYTATDDIASSNPFQLNSITFGAGGGTFSPTIQGNAANGTTPGLQFSISSSDNLPSITNNSGASSVSITNNIIIDAGAQLTYSSTAKSKTTITGAITGGSLSVAGNLLIDSPASGVNLSTFSGGISQSSGNLVIGSRADLNNVRIGTNITASGPINITGGTFDVESRPAEPTAPPPFNNQTFTTIFCGSLTIARPALLLMGGSSSGSVIVARGLVTISGGFKGTGTVQATAAGGTKRGTRLLPFARFQPGDDPGILTIGGGLELDAGSTFAPIIDGNVPATAGSDPSTEYSMANITDTGTALDSDSNAPGDGSAPNPILAPVLNYDPTPSDQLFLMVNNDTSPFVDGSSPSGSSPGYFCDSNNKTIGEGGTIDLTNTMDNYTYQFNVNYDGNFASQSISGGDDLVLYNATLVAVPEPAWTGIVVLGGLGIVSRRRRSSRDIGSNLRLAA